MKLGARIFFSFMLILVLCFSYPIDYLLDTLRTRYLEGVEDPLVDQAHILAALAAREFKPEVPGPKTRAPKPSKSETPAPESGEPTPPDLTQWGKALTAAHEQPLSARIYNLNKQQVDLQIYITDEAGRVMYDSRDPRRVGEDFSHWRDVHRTLQGKYGARTTQADPADPLSSVLYVAAPIRVGGEIAGVLTVVKPTTNINNFLREAKPRIIRVGLLSALVAILAGLGVSLFWTRPIHRLTRYAEAVGQGRRVPFPLLDRTEIGTLGRAFERMRTALEGKRYVEDYVQNLTHELKSPLSAIRGAAELMGEKDMTDKQRRHFLGNIRSEVDRIQQIVNRMLALASLENRKPLQKKERVGLSALINTVLEGLHPQISKAHLRVEAQIHDNLWVNGDGFLLHQAIANLIHNAIEFSPDGGRIVVRSRVAEGALEIEISDEGIGIPEYALTKIFDKFYSLRRPGNRPKSTGLGLNFVKEIAAIHGGTIQIRNRKPQGVWACLQLPLPSIR